MFGIPLPGQTAVTYALGVALIGASALAMQQHLSLLNTRLDLKEEQRQTEELRANRESAARIYASSLDTIRRKASAEQSKAADDHQTEILRLANAAAAERVRNQRLLDGAESRAARYRAVAEAGPASCSRLADRSIALDRQLAEGISVVNELRSVVERRDSEVALLLTTINSDRAAVSAAEGAAATQ